MGRVYDPARATRERLLLVERRQKAKEESQAVGEGVAETMALSRRRGTAFAEVGGVGRARQPAYHRMTGLDWLAKKGRISVAQKAAGERYGALYRRTAREGAIRSTLDVRPGGGGPTGPGAREEVLLMAAEGSAQAEARLGAMRARLWDQADLVSACDLVCGQELTPREAVASEREVGRIEALVAVALDVLAGESRARG